MKMKEKQIKRKTHYIFPFVGLFLILLLVFLFLYLKISITQSFKENAVRDNQSLAYQKAAVVSGVMDRNMGQLKSFLAFADFEFRTEADEYDAFTAITSYTNELSSYELAYILQDGRIYNQNGTRAEGLPEVFADADGAQSPFVSPPFYDQAAGVYSIGIYYPSVDENGAVSGVAALYNIARVYSDCNYAVSDDLLFFIRTDGKIVYSPLSQTMEDVGSVLDEYAFREEAKASFLENMQTGENLFSVTAEGSEDVIAVFHKISVAEDWYAMLVVPGLSYSAQAEAVTNLLMAAGVFVIACIVLLVIYFTATDYRYNHKLFQAESIDPVAECSNQVKFESDCHAILKKFPAKKYGMLYVNIRNFSHLSQFYGFQQTNEIIYTLSKTIAQNLQRGETYGRLSTGRFGLLLRYESSEELQDRFDGLSKNLYEMDGFLFSRFNLKLNAGAYCIDRSSGDTVAQMVDKAVFAQKTIDQSNSVNCCYYDEKNLEEAANTSAIEANMGEALKNGEFKVYFQPKYSVTQNRIDGAEALARWVKPDGTVIQPSQFIPVFEKNVFIAQLDKYMFETTCKMLREMIREGKKVVPVSINVSRATAEDPGFLEYYIETKKKYGIGDRFLELEFTESLAMESYEFLRKTIAALHENGFLCSMDDFGEGFSSLKALRSLPFDILKLDKCFLDKSGNDNRDEYLIAGVIAMARALNMKVVMEGVETKEQYLMLKRIGCETVQGYLYSKPLSHDEFTEFVQNSFQNKKRELVI